MTPTGHCFHCGERITTGRRYLVRMDDEELPVCCPGCKAVAEFIRLETDPDALVRARAAAVAGRDRHPGSVGGQRCNHIVASIEAPSYSLAAMAVDGAGPQSPAVELAGPGGIDAEAHGGEDAQGILVDLLDLAPLRDRPLENLSGGEQRKVNLARVFVQEPELMLLDEPMAGLDLNWLARMASFSLWITCVKSRSSVSSLRRSTLYSMAIWSSSCAMVLMM